MDFFLFLSPICVCLSSFFIIYTIRFFDIVEKEPLKPILFAFILGIASAFSTGILISYIPTPTLLLAVLLDLGEVTYENLYTFIDAPLIEELLKFVGLIIVYKFFKRDFHTLTDFIIYGCVVAAGFQFLLMEFNGKRKSNCKWIHASFMDIVVWSRTLDLGKNKFEIFKNDFFCFYFYPLAFI